MMAGDEEHAAMWPHGMPSPPHTADGLDPAAVMWSIRDFDGYVIEANPTCRSVLGWSVEELSSVPYWEFLHPDDQHPTVERTQQMLLSGPMRIVDLEVRMLCRDGTYRWTRWNSRSSARAERLYSVGIDITDHAFLDTGKRVLVGYWDWHIPSDTSTWSDGMFEIYGFPPGGPCSYETALSRLYGEDRSIVERAIRRTVASGEPYFADHRIVLPNGDMRWLHSAGRVISGDDGTAERIRGITMDITDRPGVRTVG